MKFIENYNDLKEGYLYCVKDITNMINGSYEIVLIKKQNDDESFVMDLIITSNDDIWDIWKINKTNVSSVPETDENFDNSRYAFYEIGPKEEFPEYFI
jgi:hypothetical protein